MKTILFILLCSTLTAQAAQPEQQAQKPNPAALTLQQAAGSGRCSTLPSGDPTTLEEGKQHAGNEKPFDDKERYTERKFCLVTGMTAFGLIVWGALQAGTLSYLSVPHQ